MLNGLFLLLGVWLKGWSLNIHFLKMNKKDIVATSAFTFFTIKTDFSLLRCNTRKKSIIWNKKKILLSTVTVNSNT